MTVDTRVTLGHSCPLQVTTAPFCRRSGICFREWVSWLRTTGSAEAAPETF